MQFANPILGGSTLIRPAIQSVNFVTGASGWQLSREGVAEFGITIVRTSFGVSADQQFSRNYVLLSRGVDSAVIAMMPTDAGVQLASAAVLTAAVDTITGSARGQLTINSPGHLGKVRATLQMNAQTVDGVTDTANITTSTPLRLSGQVNLSGGADVVLASGSQLQTVDAVMVGGVDTGLGLLTNSIITASTGAVGNTETVAMTLPSMTYAANRAYRVVFEGNHSVSVASNSTDFRIRKTNAAGQQLQDIRFPALTTTSNWAGFSSVFIVGASALPATVLVLTIIGSAAHNSNISAAATRTAALSVYDIGAASDYSGAPTLV